MSTLSGIASKGEKGRSKFQSLDINNLYRGESLEPSQQKSTLPRRHGMQCLGKVPSARRPPANLPSLKSEHSGNDPAVSLVPSGGTGWGSKPGETTGPATTTSQPHTTPPAANIPVAAPQPPAAAPVIQSAVNATPSNVNPPPANQGPPPVMQQTVHSDKLWSSVMASPGEGLHPPSFLAHQSPQFQQEFPKLSSGDGQVPATGQKGGSDTQYGPGPSLRPQTEGSWIQGGGRNAGQPPGQMPPGGASGSHPVATPAPGPLPHMQPGNDPTGGRSNLGPCVAPAGVMGPGGPTPQAPNAGNANVLPGVPPGGNMMPHMPGNAAQPQFSRNIMSQFQIYRGFSPNFQGPIQGPGPVRPGRYQFQTDNRFAQSRPTPSSADDELVPRPIIKEEELSKMDDIARDAGWATHDDDIVDYNQQLLFSDDEGTAEDESRKDKSSSKDDKRSNDRDVRENDPNERNEHRDDHRDKRGEVLPPRGPPEQAGRNWQSGRPSVNMDFRPPSHGPGGPPAHALPHGGPGPTPLDCPIPPVIRPVAHPGQGPGPHVVEDEEIWTERRRQQNANVQAAVEKAKQRKEEEEKRFQGTKQGAARRLQALEKKISMKLAAENKDHHDDSSSAGPDWEKDKNRDNRERDRSCTSSEGRDEKVAREGRDSRESRDNRDAREHRERDSEFRQISQIGERPSFLRGEREMPRNERECEISRGDRERDIPRNERERDIPRNERDRDIPRNERDRDLPRNERDRDITRNERDITRSERDIPRSERDLTRSERERDITRSERDIPRSERERDLQRTERERDIPRPERERDIPRSERERDIPRSERERDVPRSERERDLPRGDDRPRDREIPRGEREREIPRSDRDRDITRNERNMPRNERERDMSRGEREREIPRGERERELPRNERDRERDVRNERDRERDLRSERERKPREARDRHDSHFLANLPPRFQRSGMERSGGFYGGLSSQSAPPQAGSVGSGPSVPGSSAANQGTFSQGPVSQPFDPRWNPPHFPSGPLTASGTTNNLKPGYMPPRGRTADSDASNSDRERERERERDHDREHDREREREIDDRERPPSRDPRDRRDRHIGDIHDNRYRSNTRERDLRSYSDTGNSNRKPGYYDGPPEYGRGYSRGSQEYDRNEYGRVRDREADDSRGNEPRERDIRLGSRENRERDGRHYDDRREGDLKEDLYDRHQPQQGSLEDHKREAGRELNRQESGSDWREKDRKLLDEREKVERRDADGRRERDRDERPPHPDNRDGRASRESRNSRDSLRDERSVHDSDHKLGVSNREVSGAWGDDHYSEMKEEKKKMDFFREARHPPGPITREKLEASELRNDTKRNLTPLKRSTSINSNDKKQDLRKADPQVPTEKAERKPNEGDAWNRNSAPKSVEKSSPDTTVVPPRFPDTTTCKPWSEQVTPEDTVPSSAAKTEEKPAVITEPTKKEPENDVPVAPSETQEKTKPPPKEIEAENEKLEEVKKEEVVGSVEAEPKREKSSRSRSRGARGRSDGRASRQGSGSYAVYRGGAMSWGQQRERGRKGLHRAPPSRASNAGEWTQATESEQSGDDASAGSSKEDASRGSGGQRRSERERESRRPPRSPKQGQKKVEKEEKNRDTRRADGEMGFGNNDPHRYDKRSGYDTVRNSGREGFAPVGEPSRRGRGGAFRRGSVGRRYGPPSSKSPFGQPQEDGKHPAGNDDPKSKNCDGAPDLTKEDLGGELVSNEDKTKLKLQALPAGVIGSGARQYGGGGKQPSQVPPRMQGKSETEHRDLSRSKSRRGGSSSRVPSHLQNRTDRSGNAPGSTGIGAKQNSSDVAEDWETTSEHSEGEEHDDGMRSGRKAYPRRDGRRSRGSGNSRASRGVTSNATSPSGRNLRPGNDKRSNGNANNGFPSNSIQRLPNAGMPGSSSVPQPNGRNPNSRNGNQAPVTAKIPGKEIATSVNRVDEMKISDPSLINQAVSDLNMPKKNRMEKDKTNALDGIDLNNFASVVVVDDQPGVTLEEERFTFDDADNGFQEVRNKKKEARQKEEQKVQQQLQQSSQPPAASQQPQGPPVQQPLPQRSSIREKEASGRQKAGKQGNSGGGSVGQIPSPVPGSNQQIPQAPIPQVPMPPNIPQGLVGGNAKSFDRQRNKLPPRLAKQRETTRIQKQQQQQQQQQYVGVHNDVSEMNKLNQSVGIFPMKDSTNPAPPPPPVNAWDKPINAALRPNSPSANAGGTALPIASAITNPAENCNLEVNEQAPSGASSQRSTPSGDKVTGKLGREVPEKTVLDGTSPPVQTIIFENTNYKSAPGELGMKPSKFSNHLKNSRIDKGRERKLGEDVEDVQLSFSNKNSGPVPEMTKTPENKTDPIQMPIAFNKNEDSVDMKLDFNFDSDLSQLTDDKKNKGMGLSRSMHIPQGVQSTISHGSTDELNFKIASVKKVWEIMPPGPPVIEHNEDGSVASTASFTPTFGNPVDSGLEPSFSKGVDGSGVAGDDGSSLNPGEVVYSSGPQIQNNPNSYSGNVAVSAVPNMVKNDVPSTSSNVCKVKPQQQAVMSAGPSPIGHPGPLSPPPFNSSNTQQGHINYQPPLGGTAAQFGSISAIPSPPTVLSYSSQQIPSQGGLYGAFQLDGTQVLSGQARSQFSGYPPYGLNQGLGQTSAFNQQSMYLQTAPHPPPSAAPDLYSSSLSQYRIPTAQGPFGQSQQLGSNPSTVLISSTSNSLMSASVKPSTQQIGAIGTKGGGPYQQSGLPSAPQPSQLYIQYDPNYLSGSQMVQRTGPVQSNVVPTIPHSSSFYSGSAGGQAGFYQATNSTLQQGPSGQPLHQTASPYGLQGYGTQSGTAAPVGLQGFSSQMAQQYRGTSLPGHSYLKSGSQHPTDHNAGSNGRTQLKSPSSSQQDVLASVSVFSSGPQIPSPKSSRSKQQGPQQQQQSPNQQQQSQQNQQQPPHHKFSPYQGITQSTQLAFQQGVRGGQMNISVRGGVPPSTQRYPAPIQRPVPFSGSGSQGANAMGGRHRPQHQQPTRQPTNVNKPGNNQPYYSHGSNVKMENVSDGKQEIAVDNKITENVSVSGTSNSVPGNSKPATSVASQPEHKIPPAENGKEESAAPAAE